MARRSPIPSFTTTLFLSSKIPGSLFLTGRIFFRERSSPVVPHPSLMFIIARFWNYYIGSSMFFRPEPLGVSFFQHLFHIANSFLVYWLVNVLAHGQEGLRVRRSGPVLASPGPKRSGRLYIGDLESVVRVFGFGEPLFLSEKFHDIPCFIVTGLRAGPFF